MQWSSAPSFEEGDAGVLGRQAGNPATISSAPVDKAEADRLQERKRRCSHIVTARVVSSHAASRGCSSTFFYLLRFTLLRKAPQRVDGRGTITPDPADLRPILRFSCVDDHRGGGRHTVVAASAHAHGISQQLFSPPQASVTPATIVST